jgi:preprotein translocase subunit SecA
MKAIMSRIGMQGGDPIYHPMLNRSIENAQKKVEERNFEIRKHLLEYDDVLNQQRKFIYEQRDAILTDENLKQRVNDATAAKAGDLIDEFKDGYRRDTKNAIHELAEQLRIRFGYRLDPDKTDFRNAEQLEKQIISDLETDIADKEGLIGHDNLNRLIRDSYLLYVDRKWLDHLENMEALREAVYLRHYAQKNPLTEYKVEGFEIFETMIEEIRQEIASRMHHIRIQFADDGIARRSASRSVGAIQTSHSSMSSFTASSHSSGSPMEAVSRPSGATVVRSRPKVGRNDPCPCGSGKKYKQCCGR